MPVKAATRDTALQGHPGGIIDGMPIIAVFGKKTAIVA